MWLIDEEAFQTRPEDVAQATKALRSARERGSLTLVVGNGPSQSAAWLHARRHPESLRPSLGWREVVRRAGAAAKLDSRWIEGHGNSVAFAQAVLTRAERENKTAADVRQALVGEIKEAFTQSLDRTALDSMIISIGPRHVVTTNYDFQLERAFASSAQDWSVLVRQPSARALPAAEVLIHKMHGSFEPGPLNAHRYLFPVPFEPPHVVKGGTKQDPESSIVITEADYDACAREIHEQREDAPLLDALSQDCLVLGKSLVAHDVSFLLALRLARKRREQAGREGFVLFDWAPSIEDEITAHNLGLHPLVINMPRVFHPGYHYFGLAVALGRLFGGDIHTRLEEAKSDEPAGYTGLVGGPHVVSVGLASWNVTGKPRYLDDNSLPSAGRRNLQYEDVEEHPGGSALTPMMVLSALDQERTVRLSAISVVGKEGDLYGKGIAAAAAAAGINTDGIVQSADEPSWHSTVLIHTSKANRNEIYPGQRVFLDRGYRKPLQLDEHGKRQLGRQLRGQHLKVLYLDKFLAQQHPPPRRDSEVDPKRFGPLLNPETAELLGQALQANPSIDVVYETGGGGSAFQHVERALAGYINIVTSSFPFFAGLVLAPSFQNRLPGWLRPFESGAEWWKSDFEVESATIEAMLNHFSLAASDRPALAPFDPGHGVFAEAGTWARRTSSSGSRHRRWFIVTLHHFGAMGFDLEARSAWHYRPQPQDRPNLIRNTSGAGDTFRGAFVYAMLRATRQEGAAVGPTLAFASDVATLKCQHFNLGEALKAIKADFSGRMGEYEARYTS